jgi:hypothetical protein
MFIYFKSSKDITYLIKKRFNARIPYERGALVRAVSDCIKSVQST